MKVAIFGGSFDPVHIEHVRLVRAACRALDLDKVLVIPSFVAPHKLGGAHAGNERLEMCRIAFQGVPEAEISDFELREEGTSYSYLTCRAFAEKYPDAQRYFLVGADMLENFFSWKNPQEIVRSVTLAACGRGEELPKGLHERFLHTFGCDFVEVPFVGGEVSSSRIRVDLAFGKECAALDQKVAEYIKEHSLYTHPVIPSALALETAERQEHSYRVACMAVARSRSLGISENKALLAAALHDCAKYLPLSSPLLKDFVPPQDVPAPVMHQYTGAYLAEHTFHISDEEVLGAIRFHASGKEDMTPLEKLVYLADLLEEGRSFEGVEHLRGLFWDDLDACFYASLRHQIDYLSSNGKDIYPLTLRAFEWEKRRQNKQF